MLLSQYLTKLIDNGYDAADLGRILNDCEEDGMTEKQILRWLPKLIAART
jgi:hypothetical protein